MDVDPLFLAVQDRMSVLEYEHWKREFEISTLEHAGRIVAVFQNKGPEFHFFTFYGHCFTRREVVDALRAVIEKYGCVTTTTPRTDPRQQRFNLRIGFKQTGVDNENVYYRLDSI